MGKEQELLQAIREGNIAHVMKIITKVHANKKLSSKKFNVNYQDADGMTFLHQAALTGNLEVMKLLIEIGCHIDTKDSKGMRPLHYAAWQGRDLPVSVLLNCSSNVNEPSMDGNSPLHLASEHGHSIVVDLLIQHGADISIKNKQHKTALDVACEFGRTKVVEALLLLDPAKDLLKNSEEDIADNNRTTCLHLAARNGHLDVIMLLIEAGIDINRQTLQGTCLHEASKYGKVDVVRLLLDRGIDASRLNSYEQTALEIVNKFTASKAAKELKQILKEASSDTPGQSVPREIPYFGSPVLGQTHFSTIKRNHSNGSKQPKSPKPSFSPGLNLSTNYSSPLFQSSRTNNITSCLDDDDVVFCSKGASPSLTSSSSSVTSAFKNQNTLCADHRDSGISSNLSVKAVKPFNQLSNSNMNSRLPQGLLSIQCDSRRCYDPTLFPANHVQGFVSNSHNRVSGGSAGSEGNVSVKSCRSYLPGYLPNNQSNNSIDFQTTTAAVATTTTLIANNNNSNNNNNRLSGQSYESGVSTSSRQSFHSNGSSSGGSGAGGEFHPGLEESGFSSLGNFPDLLSQGNTNADIMHGWLSSMKLEELFHLFKEAGYDMPTISRMTPEDLNAIGITKPNVRKKLKFEIGRLNVPDGLPDFIPNTVHDWLELLNLVQYEHALMSQGYKDINSLLQITWEDLEEIGVTKLGHQKKITLAIDRLKRLLSNSSSPASSSDCLATTTAPHHLRHGQPFPLPPYNQHTPHQNNIHPGLSVSAFNAEGRCVDYNRFAFPDLPRSPLLLNSFGTAFASSNSSLYASISDTIGRRGSVGSTSGIGTTRNWKSTSGESLQRMVELRNLSDFLAADPAAARFDDLNVWQPQVTSAGDQQPQTLASLREGLGRMQSFNPQLRRDPSLRLSAERTFCSPRQLSLFSNNAFNFGFSHPPKRQSPEVAMNVSVYQPISSGDSTPTNDRRLVPTSTASFGDSGFFQDTLNNNNNNNSNISNSNNSSTTINNNNNNDESSINSLLNHYMNSSGDDNNDDNSNSFQRQKSVEAQDHPLLPPSYLYGTDQSERKASDELRDLTLRTGPYASIPQSSAPDSAIHVSPGDLVAGSHVIRKDQPPPPPVRSNSFRAESRSLFGLVGDKLHHGGRFEILSNSIAVVTEEEDECADDSERVGGQCGSDSSSGSEDSDMNGTGTLRKSNSTASLSSSDGSVGTLDGNTLPFANENVGTIKQRNNNHSDRSDAKQPTDDTSDSVSNHSDEANNNSRCYENNVPETGRIANVSEMNENSSGQNNSNSDKLFNDIDGMLLGLTQELDEMLKLQP